MQRRGEEEREKRIESPNHLTTNFRQRQNLVGNQINQRAGGEVLERLERNEKSVAWTDKARKAEEKRSK